MKNENSAKFEDREFRIIITEGEFERRIKQSVYYSTAWPFTSVYFSNRTYSQENIKEIYLEGLHRFIRLKLNECKEYLQSQTSIKPMPRPMNYHQWCLWKEKTRTPYEEKVLGKISDFKKNLYSLEDKLVPEVFKELHQEQKIIWEEINIIRQKWIERYEEDKTREKFIFENHNYLDNIRREKLKPLEEWFLMNTNK